MQHSSVKRLFSKQLEYYSRRDHDARFSKIIPLFLKWSKNKKKIQVAEFGGSAGQLLNELALRKDNLSLTNIEFLAAYKKRQVSKKIKFIKSSIIENKIASKKYDCIIIRDVLHHLVGSDLKSTRSNQLKALSELNRIVKSSGVIFIEELVDESLIISRLLYVLLKINSLIKIKIPKLDLNPDVQVLFLTKDELIRISKETFSGYNISGNYYPNSDIYEKIGHLGSRTGHLVLEITKNHQ